MAREKKVYEILEQRFQEQRNEQRDNLFESGITPYDTLEEYRLANSEEMWQYERISPKESGLSVDIFVDDDASYQSHNHPQWIYFRNSYNSESCDYVPILISKEPEIPLQNHRLNISLDDLRKIKQYIVQNYHALLQMADRETERLYPIQETNNHLSEMATLHTHEGVVRESLNEHSTLWDYFDNFQDYKKQNKEELWEYLTIETYKAKLPVSIYVDDSSSYRRRNHPMWLYFRAFYKRNIFLPMSIGDNPTISIKNPKMGISESDLMKIKKFIVLNKDILMQLANEEINDIEFLDAMNTNLNECTPTIVATV